MADYVEQHCTFEHDGHTYESGGAVVTDTCCIAYLGPCQHSPLGGQHRDVVGCVGEVQSWHGAPLGRYRITHKWPVPSGHVSRIFYTTHMYQVEVRIGTTITLPARIYTGRSCGAGMVFVGKRKASDLHKPTVPKLLTLNSPAVQELTQGRTVDMD